MRQDWLDREVRRAWRPERVKKQPFLDFKDYRRGLGFPAVLDHPINFTQLTYNDFFVLIQYVDHFGRILPRRDTGLTARQHRIISRLIHQARIAAVMPFIIRAKLSLKSFAWKKSTFIRKWVRKRFRRKRRKARKAGKPYIPMSFRIGHGASLKRKKKRIYNQASKARKLREKRQNKTRATFSVS